MLNLLIHTHKLLHLIIAQCQFVHELDPHAVLFLQSLELFPDIIFVRQIKRCRQRQLGHGTKHSCSLHWPRPKKLIICDGSGGWRLPNRKLSITNFFKTWWSYIKLPDPFGLPQRQRQYCGWFWALGSLSGCMAALLYEIKWIDLLAVGLISRMRQSIIYMTHKNIGGNNHSFACAIRRKK